MVLVASVRLRAALAAVALLLAVPAAHRRMARRQMARLPAVSLLRNDRSGSLDSIQDNGDG